MILMISLRKNEMIEPIFKIKDAPRIGYICR